MINRENAEDQGLIEAAQGRWAGSRSPSGGHSVAEQDPAPERDTDPRSSLSDEALFDQIYRRYVADVTAYALRRCSADDAADVVSETFVVAWRRISDVPEDPAVKPWLLGVARRVLSNQRRGFRRRGALVEKISSHLVPHLRVAPAAEIDGEAQLLNEALKTLSAADRELLLLIAWEELTPLEVATALDISPATVRTRLFRARKRLVAAAGKLDQERSDESGHVDSKNGTSFMSFGQGVRTS